MRRGLPILAAALLLLLAAAAASYVPSIPQVAWAIAKANRDAGRHRLLEVDLTVHLGAGTPAVAQGRLLSDPQARARMELRHQSGFVERHLRRSGGVLAARDGQEISAPRPLLPPFWIFQAGSRDDWMARVSELGVDTRRMALGYDGDHDCYVFGDKAHRAALWVDQETLSAVRLDLDGVVYRFGPPAADDALALPSWSSVEGEDMEPVVFELGTARAGSAEADAFRSEWLTQP